MSRIDLPEGFYEDEVREGFYVPSAIKQAWGAQIQVLNEIDRICDKLGIKYFIAMGTFLGAVRHGGFVPWDDDLDMCMLRDDYNRFLDEGAALLPDGYAVYNFRTKEEHTSFNTNIVAKSRICFEPEHLERFHGFPYIVGVDLFPLDYVSTDEQKQELMRLKAQCLIKISDEFRDGKLEGEERKKRFDILEDQLGITIPSDLSDSKIGQFLDIKTDELFASFIDEKDETEWAVYMMPFGLDNIRRVSKRDFSRQVYLPFETGEVPVPLLYDDALKNLHPDYMAIHKGWQVHDYPFFLKSQAQLQEVLDFELPEFKVTADELLRMAEERATKSKNMLSGRAGSLTEDTYRCVVNECISEIERLIGVLKDTDDIIVICGQLQQIVIDLGTYMEAIKGKGYDLVALLEKFCEALYKLAQADSDDEAELLYAALCEQFQETADKIRLRKEVLFLPFKGEYWGSFEAEYRKVSDDPDADVYIVPIPYYYKDYMGRLHDMQFAPEKYPAELELTGYDDYDYALRHPDVIYIQSPYDEWNVATSLPPFFYSEKLLKYTDELIYIPWFKTDDFTRENGPEYVNMRYYCTMPGVVNADCVILQSETIRNTYIEKLCDFAGEKTRKVWEDKIVTRKYDIGSEEFFEGEDAKSPGTLLYYPDFSCILKNGQQAIDKIRDVIKICKLAEDTWRFVFFKGRFIDDKLREIDPKLYDKYIELLGEVSRDESFDVISEGESDYETLVKRCSAYYGDGGHLAHVFRNAGKPVKLQDYGTRDIDNVNDIYECADFWTGK